MAPELGMQDVLQAAYADRMTTTDTTNADLALAELHEHLEAIARLSRAPFHTNRIDAHRAAALECLDAVAQVLAA